MSDTSTRCVILLQVHYDDKLITIETMYVYYVVEKYTHINNYKQTFDNYAFKYVSKITLISKYAQTLQSNLDLDKYDKLINVQYLSKL